MTKSGHTLAAAVDSTVGEENPNLVPEVHSIHGNVAEAIVIKNGNLFFLSEPDGTLPLVRDTDSAFTTTIAVFLTAMSSRSAARNRKCWSAMPIADSWPRLDCPIQMRI